ncbi:MAG TPA: hypothetical protein VK843_07190 [Planctomycetota bacterium]|nr:hypothetical protein [Planctomycetota bacterium]
MDFSANWIMSSMLVSTIGGGFFIYGKKQSRLPQLLCGIALIVESMFVSSVLWMFVIAVAAIVGLAAVVRAGM